MVQMRICVVVSQNSNVQQITANLVDGGWAYNAGAVRSLNEAIEKAKAESSPSYSGSLYTEWRDVSAAEELLHVKIGELADDLVALQERFGIRTLCEYRRKP
jgi:hypothetical protein